MRRRLTLLCVLPFTLSTSTFAQSPSAVATPEAPVTDCDRYAASDLDPQRKATGVPVDKANPALAAPACEAAVRQFPNTRRLIFQLGRSYEKVNNFSAALDHYRKAAERDHAAAQNALGYMYTNGKGVPKDDHQAIAWYRKAAEQGLPAAQSNLGYMYASGHGVPQDYQQAVAWYRKAAEQNYAVAQKALGWMYENGLGVSQDSQEAVVWYRKAAEQELAKQLSDGALDQLSEIALDEAKWGGRLPPSVGADSTRSSRRPSGLLTEQSTATHKSIHQRKGHVADVSLTRGQVNAVRAAFKAGITPSRIARRFRISQSKVRKALSSHGTKR